MRTLLARVIVMGVWALWLTSPHAVVVALAADEKDEASPVEVPEVVVYGKPISRTDVTAAPEALPASTTILDAKAIQRTPIVNSYVDLFRPLPGFNVNNFGQGGIGNGISIR
ncbi:MAG: TonB-dependent receptor, partial [Nitrospiraceae bacterium]